METRNCAACGKPFPMTRFATSMDKKCCCRKCSAIYHYRIRNGKPLKGYSPETSGTGVCIVCGNTFPMTPRARAKGKKYCCKKCKSMALDKKRYEEVVSKRDEKECPVCHKLFKPSQKFKAYCSEECRIEHENTRNKIRATTEATREYHRKYREKNKEKLNTRSREYNRKRRSSKKRQVAIELQKDEVVVKSNSKSLKQLFIETIGIERLSSKSCKCLKCGKDFNMKCKCTLKVLKRLSNLGKSPCPWCGEAPTGTIQRGGQVSVYEMELKRLYPNLTVQSYRPGWMGGMEIDLYDPETHVGIEFHGLLAHSTKKMEDRIASRKHKEKADLCEKNGVHLVQLYETEWEQKREIVKDKLDAIFHKDMKRLFARKLKVLVLGDRDSRASVMKFLYKNHIQGRTACQWAVVLLDGMETVAVCTFKYGTAYAIGGQTGGTEKYWELNRYATKLGYSIVGGLSRCIKAFAKAHPDVHKIVSFADRRWTSRLRSAYSSSGFVEVAECEPNYQYTDLDSRHELKNKQYMRKSQIAERATHEGSPESAVYSPDKTESQMSKELGYYRVYDAGKIRYEMTL